MKKLLITSTLFIMSALFFLRAQAQISIGFDVVPTDETPVLYCQESDTGIIGETSMPYYEEDCGYTQGSCDLMYSSESCGVYNFVCQPATYNACSSTEARQAQQQRVMDLGPLSEDPKAVVILVNLSKDSNMLVKTIIEANNMKPTVKETIVEKDSARIISIKKDVAEFKKIESAVVLPKDFVSKEFDWKNRDFKWTVNGVQKTGTLKSKMFVAAPGFKDA